MRRLWLSLALAAAVITLVGPVVAALAYSRTPPRYASHTTMGGGAGYGTAGMMNRAGMMGSVWLAGDGTRVTSIAAARAGAATAASPAGLHPGEVIWFDNGFYVELEDAAGNPATEVLVDPYSGAVGTEPGPAMMWNARYGMHRTTADGAVAVSADQARRTADAWLAANRPGRHAEPADAYPGYYTLETPNGRGTVDGMLSVNATTGQVWYHTWHGRFIAKEDM